MWRKVGYPVEGSAGRRGAEAGGLVAALGGLAEEPELRGPSRGSRASWLLAG